jgi:RimJ/RimL family protein N-acetyltransferase
MNALQTPAPAAAVIAPATAAAAALFPWVTRDEVFRIETPRMWLRWPNARDAARLHGVASHRQVAGMTATWPHPLPEGEAARRIASARLLNAEGSAMILAITLKGDPSRLMGMIGCNALAAEHLGIGYMLDPASAGQGLATEAVQGFVQTLFTHTGLTDISASSRTVNPASRRVLEKAGFTAHGSGMLDTTANGEVSVDFLALSRAAWKGNLEASRRHLHVASASN